MPKNDLVPVRHMLDSAREALSFIARKPPDSLRSDRLLALACVRLLEIVGEAANQVSPEFRSAHPEIPWPKIIGMRNRLIHGYVEINLQTVWETLTVDLPPLIAALENILEPPTPPTQPAPHNP